MDGSVAASARRVPQTDGGGKAAECCLCQSHAPPSSASAAARHSVRGDGQSGGPAGPEPCQRGSFCLAAASGR